MLIDDFKKFTEENGLRINEEKEGFPHRTLGILIPDDELQVENNVPLDDSPMPEEKPSEEESELYEGLIGEIE